MTPQQQQAMQVLAKWLQPTLASSVGLEQSWEVWLRTLYGPWISDVNNQPIPFAPHLRQIWEWFWQTRLGVKQDPLIAILPRGGAKSTTAELGVAAWAARRSRKYGLYVCSTQPQSDDHVQNIGALFENPDFAKYYPEVANRRVGKYGYSSGWNRQRLRTQSGFTIDSIGLDTAARGVKLEEARPDFIIFDDIDKELDSTDTTDRKIKLITTSLLPAGSKDCIVLGVQNLVIEDGVFARLAGLPNISMRADFLQNRIMIGPLPSIMDPVVIVPSAGPRAGKYTIVSGTPIWEGQNLTKAQQDIDEWGYTAWLSEAQQDVEVKTDSLFSNVPFDHILVTKEQLPALVRTVVWCDPAVTSTDRSDSHGIQVDALGADDLVYRLWSWENIDTPDHVLRLAITKAIEYFADHVGVETDQGGDLWELTYDHVWDEMVADGTISAAWNTARGKIPFKAEKAGAGYGNKAHRASLMARDYGAQVSSVDGVSLGLIRHVINNENTHLILKKALLRFPHRKPYDLVDAAFWGWNDLKGGAPIGIGGALDTPVSAYGTRQNTMFGQRLHGNKADEAYTQDSDRMRVGRLWQGHAGRRTMWRQGQEANNDDERSPSTNG